MYCEKCGNKIKNEDTFCTKCGTKINPEMKENNKPKLKIKLVYVIITVATIILLTGIGIFVLNNKNSNKNENIFNQNENNETTKEIQNTETIEPVYITQNSDVSLTGKEFIGIFSDFFKSVYEKNHKNSNYTNITTYDTSMDNIKAYAIESKTDNEDKAIDEVFYYNTINNHFIGAKLTFHNVRNIVIGLQNNSTTYEDFIAMSTKNYNNFFMNYHNMSDGEKNSSQQVEWLNKWDNFIVKVTPTENKLFNFNGYDCYYRVYGYDYIIANVHLNSNAEEFLYLAYDKNTNPEETIKQWYDKVNIIEQEKTSIKELENIDNNQNTQENNFNSNNNQSSSLNNNTPTSNNNFNTNASTNNNTNSNSNSSNVIKQKKIIDIIDIDSRYYNFEEAKKELEKRGLKVNEIIEEYEQPFISYSENSNSWKYKNENYNYYKGDTIDIIHTKAKLVASKVRTQVDFYQIREDTNKIPVLKNNPNLSDYENQAVQVYIDGKLAFTFTYAQYDYGMGSYEYSFPYKTIHIKLVAPYAKIKNGEEITYKENWVIKEYDLKPEELTWYFDLYTLKKWY